jgi:hypothetical protein
VLIAWGHGSISLTERFDQARLTWADPPRCPTTYQGFVKALARVGEAMITAAVTQLHTRMRRIAGRGWRRLGWCVLAVDGSRFELPRTEAHEQAFGVNGRSASGPQAWVTMLWHLGLGLPWSWKIDQARASERGHLLEMLDGCPTNALLVADAGFTGYDVIRRVVDSGRHVLIRVGRAVKLLRDLGYSQQADAQTVYLWPDRAQKDRQPPLVLRLIAVRSSGDCRRKVYLLTSVTDPDQLSDEDASVLYRMRWGIELCYRSLKQTLQARKLRAHSPAVARFELHGLILGLTLLGLLSLEPILAAGHDPLRWSVAASLRAVRQSMRQPDRPFDPHRDLARAIHDPYVRRRKTRRPWPRKKPHDPPPGKPHIRRARQNQITLAQQLQAA